MTTAELWVHYHQHPPVARKPLDPVQSSATVAVLPYHQWIRNKCACCHRGGSSGVWRCEFTNQVALYTMCAACGLRDGFAKWNGFYSRKLIKIDLIVTLTYQSRTEVPVE